MGDLDDLAAAARDKAQTHPTPTANHPPPVPAKPAAHWNFFAKWKRWSGTKSFIFQIVLIGWTTLFLFLGLASLFMAAADSHSQNPFENPQDAQTANAAVFGGSLCCLIGVWALVAIPLGIGAFATLKSID